jgi:hypothetical protein
VPSIYHLFEDFYEDSGAGCGEDSGTLGWGMGKDASSSKEKMWGNEWEMMRRPGFWMIWGFQILRQSRFDMF